MRKVLHWGLVLAAAALFGGCTASRTVIVHDSTPGPVAKAPGQVNASRVHTRNGKRFFERGQYRKAIQQFELAVAKDPNNWEAHYYLGESYRELRDYDRCLVHYHKVRDLSPSDAVWVARVEVSIGTVYERRGNWAKAREHYEFALVAVPGYEPARVAKGRMLSKKFKEKSDDDDDHRRGHGKKHDD
jgi:tetratricopeptide (TPR) repeat protein